LVSQPLDKHSIKELEASAEAVRAYLVELRGGAPFLSGADSRLLVGWLERGVAVPVITAGLDLAAERRRKARGRGKPARSRLTLSAARGLVDKQSKIAPQIEAAGLQTWRIELEQMEVTPALSQAKSQLILAVSAIPASDPDAAGRAAIEACRAFQSHAWQSASQEADTLLSSAKAQLGALQNILDAGAFATAVEEVARDMVHARTPLVSAKVVWDRLTVGARL
jgi:hypothetical protein